MEVPSEVLWTGVGLGFSGMALALRVVYTNGKATAARIEKALGDRIGALEEALTKAQKDIREQHNFERETLVGLVVECSQAAGDCHRQGRRLSNIIESLKKRYGTEVLEAAEEAKRQAERADTDRMPRPQTYAQEDPSTPLERRFRIQR